MAGRGDLGETISSLKEDLGRRGSLISRTAERSDAIKAGGEKYLENATIEANLIWLGIDSHRWEDYQNAMTKLSKNGYLQATFLQDSKKFRDFLARLFQHNKDKSEAKKAERAPEIYQFIQICLTEGIDKKVITSIEGYADYATRPPSRTEAAPLRKGSSDDETPRARGSTLPTGGRAKAPSPFIEAAEPDSTVVAAAEGLARLQGRLNQKLREAREGRKSSSSSGTGGGVAAPKPEEDPVYIAVGRIKTQLEVLDKAEFRNFCTKICNQTEITHGLDKDQMRNALVKVKDYLRDQMRDEHSAIHERYAPARWGGVGAPTDPDVGTKTSQTFFDGMEILRGKLTSLGGAFVMRPQAASARERYAMTGAAPK